MICKFFYPVLYVRTLREQKTVSKILHFNYIRSEKNVSLLDKIDILLQYYCKPVNRLCSLKILQYNCGNISIGSVLYYILVMFKIEYNI